MQKQMTQSIKAWLIEMITDWPVSCDLVDNSRQKWQNSSETEQRHRHAIDYVRGT